MPLSGHKFVYLLCLALAFIFCMGMDVNVGVDFDGVGIAFGAVSLEVLTTVVGAATFVAVMAGLSPPQASAAVRAAVHDAMLRRAAPARAWVAPVYMDVHDYEGFECCEGREVDTGLAECEEPEVEDSQPALFRLDAAHSCEVPGVSELPKPPELAALARSLVESWPALPARPLVAEAKDRAKANLAAKVEDEGVHISPLAVDGGRLKPAPRDAEHSRTDADDAVAVEPNGADAAADAAGAAEVLRVFYERLGLSASTLACRLEIAGLA